MPKRQRLVRHGSQERSKRCGCCVLSGFALLIGWWYYSITIRQNAASLLYDGSITKWVTKEVRDTDALQAHLANSDLNPENLGLLKSGGVMPEDLPDDQRVAWESAIKEANNVQVTDREMPETTKYWPGITGMTDTVLGNPANHTQLLMSSNAPVLWKPLTDKNSGWILWIVDKVIGIARVPFNYIANWLYVGNGVTGIAANYLSASKTAFNLILLGRVPELAINQPFGLDAVQRKKRPWYESVQTILYQTLFAFPYACCPPLWFFLGRPSMIESIARIFNPMAGMSYMASTAQDALKATGFDISATADVSQQQADGFRAIDEFLESWIPAWHIPHNEWLHLRTEPGCDAPECIKVREEYMEQFTAQIRMKNSKVTTRKRLSINRLMQLLVTKDGQKLLTENVDKLNSHGNLSLVIAWRTKEFKSFVVENDKSREFLASKKGKQVAKVLELNRKEIIKIHTRKQKELDAAQNQDDDQDGNPRIPLDLTLEVTEDSVDDTSFNWLPWAVLFLLLVAAGVALYFYRRNDKFDEEELEDLSADIEQPVQKSEPTPMVESKVTPTPMVESKVMSTPSPILIPDPVEKPTPQKEDPSNQVSGQGDLILEVESSPASSGESLDFSKTLESTPIIDLIENTPGSEPAEEVIASPSVGESSELSS